jgi:hypothetical protein
MSPLALQYEGKKLIRSKELLFDILHILNAIEVA